MSRGGADKNLRIGTRCMVDIVAAQAEPFVQHPCGCTATVEQRRPTLRAIAERVVVVQSNRRSIMTCGLCLKAYKMPRGWVTVLIPGGVAGSLTESFAIKARLLIPVEGDLCVKEMSQ